MKPQDIIFLLVLAALLIFRKSKWIVIAGLLCLAVAMPLFAMHIFFTAQRVTYYAGGFFLIAAVLKIYENRY